MTTEQKKKVRIHLSRKLTFERPEHDPLKLHAGHNEVDADVAAHPFVKAHLTDAPSVVDSKELDEANAKIGELVAALDEANAKIKEQATIIKAFEATAPKK